MAMTGSCRCGASRYDIAGDAVTPIYCCHCLDCQRWSGSAFTEQAVLRDGALSATGPVVPYSYTARSGTVSTQHVCGTCHTRLWNTNTARPGLALVRAGTLDGSEAIIPRAHIWTKRKQPWIAIPDDVPSWPENAPTAELAAALMR